MHYYITPVFIHEFMHILGFSGDFFRRKNMLGEINFGSVKTYAVVSPGVVKMAQEYFGCKEL